MTVAMMDTLAQVLKDARATPDERDLLVAAAQNIDDLDELAGDALRVYLDLRARMAEGATRMPRLAAALVAAGRPASAAVLDGFDHGACTLTFCRSPLHPGPCKGWRDHLRANAPGVARALDRIDADRREARKAASPKAQTPAGVTAGQANALESVGRSGSAGKHPRTMSPQMRKKLTDAGLLTTEDRQGADGKMSPALVLTPKGQALVDARNAARQEATRRIEERALAEGLDPVEAKLGGLPHARRQRAQREDAGIRARRAEAERGAPPAPTAVGGGAGYGDENYTKARSAAYRNRLQAGIISAAGGVENITPEQRERLAQSYLAYTNSYGDVDAHRRHTQAWADRLAYLNDSRELHSDPAVRAEHDRLTNEARAGYDKAAADLAEAGKRAEAAREAAGEAIVSVYQANGKRKSIAALKLPPAADATPPESKVRLAAEVDAAVRARGGDDVPPDAPERRAVVTAATARIAQEREVAALQEAQERNRRARSDELHSEQRGVRGPESTARLKAIDAEGDRLAKELNEARGRLADRQETERVAGNRLRQHVAEVRERERQRDRNVQADEMDAARVAVAYRQASQRLFEGLDDGERAGPGNRLRGMIDRGMDPAMIIAEAEKEARRAEAASRGGSGYQSPIAQDNLRRAARTYEAVARLIRESGATSGTEVDPSRGGMGDTPQYRGALARLREGFDGAPGGRAAEIQALLVAGEDPGHVAREATRAARSLDRSIEQASRSRTTWRTRVALLREQGAYEAVAKAMEERTGPEVPDLPDPPNVPDVPVTPDVPESPGARRRGLSPAEYEQFIAQERARAALPQNQARSALQGMEDEELERGRAMVARLAAGEDPRILAGEARRRIAAIEALRGTDRWDRIGPRRRASAARNLSSYRAAIKALDAMPAPAGNPAYDPLDRVADVNGPEAATAANIRARIERGDDPAGLIVELRARAKEMDSVSRKTKTVDVVTRNAATRNRAIYLGIVKELERRGVTASLDGGPPGQLLATSGRGALVAALVSMVREHFDCDEFCRNGTAPGEKPIHPGPCRGWKDALRKVAPGALKIIEDERRRKLAEKRAGKPPAKKAAPRVRPKPEPEPEPESTHRVRLSPETRQLANEVARELPQDEAGWHGMVNRRQEPRPRTIDRRIADEERTMAREQENWDRAIERARESVRQQRSGGAAARRRKTLTEAEEKRAQAEAADDATLGGKAYADARKQAEELKRQRAEIDRKTAAGEKLDLLESIYANRLPGTETRTDYDQSVNGEHLPPEALRRAEARVREVGAALSADINRAMDADPVVQAARAERAAAMKVHMNRHNLPLDERIRAQNTLRDTNRTINNARRELVLDALNQIRPTGNNRHTSAGPVGLVDGYERARADWPQRLAIADSHFPDDWVEASSRARLSIGSRARAGYAGGTNGWETAPPADRIGILGMTREERARNRPAFDNYGGGFADMVDEVSVHEMGHRMEQHIPGLRALEFAYVRAQTTRDGRVEPRVRLRDVEHSGYGPNEVAYRDDFTNAYTGRSYYQDRTPNDPAASSWEVFQVGLQQTYGSETQFGPDSLVDFTLGALATLGRTDL